MTDLFQTSGTSPTGKTRPRLDFSLENHGSVFLLKPITDRARAWIESHIDCNANFQPWWPTVVIGHNYVEAVCDGITADGLEVA